MSSRVVRRHDAGIWPFAGSPEVKRFIFIAGVSALAILPALLLGIPSNRDLSNHFRFALPFYDAIAGGDFYPGWLAESNAGYGDPSFRFYPPALYYLFAAFKFVTGEWYVATLLALVTLSLAGSLGIYVWARSILNSSQAMWVSLIYAIAPYHLNQLYQATMLAEWAGSAVLPFTFAFVERICARGRRRDVAGFAACYALLVLIHLPLTVIGSIALLVYALARMEAGRRIQTLVKLSLATALGLCASSVYWLTMITELGWIGINNVVHDASVDYRFNFILSTLSPDNLNVWWMNILALMTLLLSAPAILLLRHPARRQLRPIVMLTGFALFMTLPLSRPVWRLLSPLQQTQFPWRWLAVISLGAALLTAAALPLLDHSKTTSARVKRLVILGAMSIAIVFTLSHVVREAKFLPRGAFAQALAEVRGTPSVNYWFPIWASSSPRPMNATVEAGDRAVSIDSWAAESRRFTVAAGRAAEARVKTFYYPHWTASSGGQILHTRPDKDGALLISLPQKATSVDLVFKEPQKSRVSAIASFAGFIFIGFLAGWRQKQ